MDAVRDDRGQAVVLAVFVIAIAATVVVGLRMQQDRAFAIERSRRAGEAAAEAATTAVADSYTAALREAVASKRPMDIGRLIGSNSTRDAARAAASEASSANGGGAIDDVMLGCAGARVEVTILASGASYRAGFPASECSRH
jgi:membrane glycosyltransferase